MTGKLSLRVSAELLDWLEGRAGQEGGSINDMARWLLMEAMMASKKKQDS
jgi:predicted HicB family RNase H-like nuclease